MDFLTCVLVGEVIALLVSTLVGVREPNDTLAYMLFGVTGAVMGGRVPAVLGYTGEPTANSVSVGMALFGSLVLIGLQMILQFWRSHDRQW